MRKAQVAGFVVASVLTSALLVLASPVSAQPQSASASKSSSEPTPRTADGRPDFSGVWNGSGESVNQKVPNGKLPYTPAGAAAYDFNMNKAQDPQALCILIGQPRADLDGQVFEIFQTPTRMAFLYERDTAFRLVWTDGRNHPDEPEPSFFGDAVGRWDGDTFVVDVVGLKGKEVWADNVGHPESEGTHLVERWTRPDKSHLQLELTIDDPKYYAKPLQVTRKMMLRDDDLFEMSCDENNVDKLHLGSGLGTKDGNRGVDKSADEKLLATPMPPVKH